MSKQTLAHHLIELKNRLILILIFFFIGFGLCYYFANNIFFFLLNPLEEILNANNLDKRIIFTSLPEAFISYVKLSFFSSLIICLPLILIQTYIFIAPGLYKKEKKQLLPFFILCPILFFLGAALLFYFIMPLAWQFFLNFEINANIPIELEAKMDQYVSLTLKMIIAFGLAFQFPLILILLNRAGILQKSFLQQKRKIWLVIILIIAAIITPPDVISQILLALPMYLLYEIAIIFCAHDKPLK